MDFKNLFTFLEALGQNNHKVWMDANRKWYQSVRADFIAWLDTLNLQLEEQDENYYPTPGKKAINRINNNLMFHPHKPVYKDHFGAALDKAPGTADFYIEIGIKQCVLAGGFWRPDAKTLRSIRDGIDYNGHELVAILSKKSFREAFGHLYKDERLVHMPKGFSSDHPHKDLLKNKSFAVAREVSRKEVMGPAFEKLLLETYFEMLPFRRYLNQAASI